MNWYRDPAHPAFRIKLPAQGRDAPEHYVPPPPPAEPVPSQLAPRTRLTNGQCRARSSGALTARAAAFPQSY